MTDRELLELILKNQEAMRSDINELKQGQTRLESKVDSFVDKTQELKTSVTELKRDVHSLKESRAKRSAAIKALADEVKALNDKMDRTTL